MELQTIKECFEIQLEQAKPLDEDTLKELIENRLANLKNPDGYLKNKIENLKTKLGKKQLFYSKRKDGLYQILSVWEDDLESLSEELKGFRFSKMIGTLTTIPQFVDTEIENV